MSTLIVAAAGSGKTETLVNMSLSNTSRVLITTYTDNNVEEIKNRFYLKHGSIPTNVVILPWYTFILTYGVKPYQDIMHKKDIRGINLTGGESTHFKSSNSSEYYFDSEGRIYADKIARLLIELDQRTKGQVLRNICGLFQKIYIDEVQDLSGYDQELIKFMNEAGIELTCVGDPRQGVFITSKGSKNKSYSRSAMLTFFHKKTSGITIDNSTLNTNYRCTKDICILSDTLYPEYPNVIPGNVEVENRMGCFLVRQSDIDSYLSEEKDIVQLRNNIKTKTNINYPAYNFGTVKGKSFSHVLIYATETIKKWLMKGQPIDSDETKAKLYVAITRAKYSVGFVVDYEDDYQNDIIKKYK